MKYKNKVAYFNSRVAWYEKQSKQYQMAHKKPGSVKVK